MLKIYVNNPRDDYVNGAVYYDSRHDMLDYLAKCVTDAVSKYSASDRPGVAKDYVTGSALLFDENIRLKLTHSIAAIDICNTIRNGDAYVCINYKYPVEHSRINICNLVTNNQSDICHALDWVIKEWMEANRNERTFMNNWEFYINKSREKETMEKILTDVTGSNYGKERTQRKYKDLDGTVYREVMDNFGFRRFEPDESATSIRDFLINYGFESTESAAHRYHAARAKRDFIRHSMNTTYGLTCNIDDYCKDDVIATEAFARACKRLGVPTPKAWDAKSNKAEKEERTEKKMKSIPTIKHISVGEEHKTGRVKTTIVWDDHTKTTVVCRDGETPDTEKGILLCVWEKMNGGSKTKAKEKLRQLVAEASKPKKEKRKANNSEGILNPNGKELVSKLTNTVKQASDAFSSAARNALGLNDED